MNRGFRGSRTLCAARAEPRAPGSAASMRRKSHRLRDSQRASRPDGVRREMIPSAQIFHAHAEPIRHGDEGIAATHCIACGPQYRRRGDRDHKLISLFDAGVRGEAVGLGDLADVGVHRDRNAVESFAAGHDVEAPTAALIVGDVLDARGIQLGGSYGDVKIERHVARRLHAQQTRIESEGRPSSPP
jgi:hypothetical protein